MAYQFDLFLQPFYIRILTIIAFSGTIVRVANKQRKLIELEERRHPIIRGRWPRLHFENIPPLRKILDFLFWITFTRQRGLRNAVTIKLEEADMLFNNLPKAFDKTRILLITDLHIDGIEPLADEIVRIVKKIDYDFCVLAGDYSLGYKSNKVVYTKMKGLAELLCKKSSVFGLLGNHDRYEIAQQLNDCGVEMLINESLCLEKDGDRIFLSGLDDCHYYKADDLALADSNIEDGAFKIIACHSPELYQQAAKAGYSLYLAGHTHGGQICLPTGLAVVTNATVPRQMVKGMWKYNDMTGYTSRGVGVTDVPVRFFCPPEMTIITLNRAKKA